MLHIYFIIFKILCYVSFILLHCCLLYTSDAADERSSVDLGGRRIIKKKKIIYYAKLAVRLNIYQTSWHIAHVHIVTRRYEMVTYTRRITKHQ